jgi:hypothetical protein
VFTPGGFGLSLLFQYGGERFWQQSGDSVISVNSDGSALQTLAGSQLAGCIYKQAVTVTDMGCDAILVLQGTSLQAYDAATGSLRLTYGTIPAPAAPLLGFVRVANYSKWGQGAIMTQTISNPTVAAPGTAISYYITTDRSGVTRLNLP